MTTGGLGMLKVTHFLKDGLIQFEDDLDTENLPPGHPP